MDGIAHTNSNTAVSTSRAHREHRLSSAAVAIPMTMLSTTVTTVNTAVRSATVQNVESVSTSR